LSKNVRKPPAAGGIFLTHCIADKKQKQSKTVHTETVNIR